MPAITPTAHDRTELAVRDHRDGPDVSARGHVRLETIVATHGVISQKPDEIAGALRALL